MKKALGYALQILLGAIVGVAIAYAAFADVKSPFYIVVNVLVVFAAFYLHIILHEAGHLVCGLLSGYQFVSFRVGAFILLKTNEGYEFTISPAPGIAGQCLLMPPPEDEPQPFLLYHLGGVLTNFLVTFCAILYICFNGIFIFAVVLAGVGVILGIINILPAASPEIPNDGANIKEAKKGPLYLEAMQMQLRVAAKLAKDESLADMSEEMFQIKEGLNPLSPFALVLRIYQYNRLQAKHDLTNAAEVMRALYNDVSDIYPYFQKEVKAEWLYCLSAILDDKSTATALFETELKKWLPKYPQIDKLRACYTYYALTIHDFDKANAYCKNAEKELKNFPYKTVAETEAWLLQDIKNKIKKCENITILC